MVKSRDQSLRKGHLVVITGCQIQNVFVCFKIVLNSHLDSLSRPGTHYAEISQTEKDKYFVIALICEI